jgi:hypothetical protein
MTKTRPAAPLTTHETPIPRAKPPYPQARGRVVLNHSTNSSRPAPPPMHVHVPYLRPLPAPPPSASPPRPPRSASGSRPSPPRPSAAPCASTSPRVRVRRPLVLGHVRRRDGVWEEGGRGSDQRQGAVPPTALLQSTCFGTREYCFFL